MHVQTVTVSSVKEYLLENDFTEYEIDSLFANKYNPEQYKIFKIRKKNGSYRQIEAPNDLLKKAQRKLLFWFNKVEQSSHVIGVKKNKDRGSGLNIRNNASKHLFNQPRIILKADIKDFFPSTTLNHFLYGFKHSKCGNVLRNFLLEATDLCFLLDPKTGLIRLPTGAPTSPIISSIAFRKADSMLCHQETDIKYSRYMDDITFSFPLYYRIQGFQKELNNIVEQNGYKLNHNKTKLLYPHNDRIEITGITIPTGITRLTINKTKRKLLRAELDKYAREGLCLDDHIIGKMNFLKGVDDMLHVKMVAYYAKRVLYYKNNPVLN